MQYFILNSSRFSLDLQKCQSRTCPSLLFKMKVALGHVTNRHKKYQKVFNKSWWLSVSPLSSGNIAWYRRDIQRVKAEPARRSNICRASTASARRRSGARRVRHALLRSTWVKAEKTARKTCKCSPAARWQVSMTSKAMASPSRSQSSHRTSHWHCRASSCNIRSNSSLPGIAFRSTGAWNRETGLLAFQTLYCGTKSASSKCPRTAVTSILQ